MNTAQRRELDREQWRDLVRGLCLVQVGGYPGCVSISKHFLQSPLDEVEQLAHMARHIVQEYGLAHPPGERQRHRPAHREGRSSL